MSLKLKSTSSPISRSSSVASGSSSPVNGILLHVLVIGLENAAFRMLQIAARSEERYE